MGTASSLTQGLALLESAVRQERSGRQGHNASRLAATTGIERSRVSRLTQELRALDYLSRDEASVLSAGSEYFRIAAALNVPWLRTARRELRALASQLRVTARITVAAGAGALLLRSETGVGSADPSVRPGMITPIWCTGSGRALLWDHTIDDLHELLADVQFIGVGGPEAARSVAEVDALLSRDRRAGLITAAEEYVEGIHEYAMPLRVRGSIVASVAVSGDGLRPRKQRLARDLLGQTVDRLATVATETDD